MPMIPNSDGADLPTVNFDPRFDEFRWTPWDSGEKI